MLNRCILPLAIVTAIYLVLTLRTAWVHAREPWPLTPWESAITVDAWRINHHQPVYTDPVNGHATHMYGPLTTWAAALGERIFGVDVRVPRAISLGASLAISIGAGCLLSARRSHWSVFLIGSLVFLQFYRIGEWSTESRPDAESSLFGFLALAMFYRSAGMSDLRQMIAWNLGGTTLLLIAYFFKQPAIVLAIVPLLAAFAAQQDLPKIKLHIRIGVALIPIVAACVTIGLCRIAAPWLDFYMIRVPASYPVVRKTWVKSWIEWTHFDVLFIFGFALWIIMRARRLVQIDRVDIWLLITIVVTTLFGTAARAKVGGGFNSLLPAIIAMSAFAIRTLDAWWNQSPTTRSMQTALIVSALFAPLLLVSDLACILHVFTPGESPQLVRHGDIYYPAVIAAASELPGKVVSLDDPTIALLAKGFAGRSGDCELDAHRRSLPDYALDDFRDAQWVIQTKASRRSTIDDQTLINLGFQPADWTIPRGASYALWRREVP